MSLNPADRVAANFARKMPRLALASGALPRLIFLGFFRIFLFRALPSVGHSAKAFWLHNKPAKVISFYFVFVFLQPAIYITWICSI
jgi:hypothetical protein